MSDDKLLKARRDGGHAHSLLHDELLQAAFSELKRIYAERLLETKVDQAPIREIFYQAHRVVGEVENHLRSILDGGKLANAELDNLIAIQERKRGLFSR